MEGRAVCKLQKASDGCCCRCRQPWPLYRCFCSLLALALFCALLSLTPLLLFSSLFAWCLWWSSARGAGAIKATAVCYRLQNPGPPSVRQPQSSYLRGPSGKPHTLEEKYLICPLCEDQLSHKRQERPGVAKGGGGKKRKWEDWRRAAGGRGSEEGYQKGVSR